ncbi:MFS transporter [Corynebacterium nuruki]|uniref:MFS transporter n=1 Tax=Corynebacterium nuruki TaxID=1032851 RepID=UPI0039BF3D21
MSDQSLPTGTASRAAVPRTAVPRVTVTRTTGACAALTLCLAIAGVNLPNPLAPLYSDRFHLTPLLQSTLFSVYLAALVLTLAATVLDPRRRSRTMTDEVRTLVTALVLTLAADLVMLAGTAAFPVLLAGRAVAGVAAGLATGSAAAVALAGLGESARTVAAGAAVVGALAANIGGGTVATLTGSGTASCLSVYLGHALLAGILAVALTGSVRRGRPADVSGAATGEPSGATPVVRVVGGYRRRHRVAGYLIGVMSWTAAGIVLALVATRVRQTSPDLSLLGAMAPGVVFLAVSWVGQLLVNRRILQLRAWQTALPLVLGLAGLGIALDAGNYAAVLLAAAVCGLGQGPCYSLGLATVTHGLPPERQGRAASVYAAVAYGSCGVLTVLAGLLANAAGVAETFTVTAVVCVVAGVTATLLAGPRLPLVHLAPVVRVAPPVRAAHGARG